MLVTQSASFTCHYSINVRESILTSSATKLLGIKTKAQKMNGGASRRRSSFGVINLPKKFQSTVIPSFSVTLLKRVPYNRIYQEYLGKLLVYF